MHYCAPLQSLVRFGRCSTVRWSLCQFRQRGWTNDSPGSVVRWSKLGVSFVGRCFRYTAQPCASSSWVPVPPADIRNTASCAAQAPCLQFITEHNVNRLKFKCSDKSSLTIVSFCTVYVLYSDVAVDIWFAYLYVLNSSLV